MYASVLTISYVRMYVVINSLGRPEQKAATSLAGSFSDHVKSTFVVIRKRCGHARLIVVEKTEYTMWLHPYAKKDVDEHVHMQTISP